MEPRLEKSKMGSSKNRVTAGVACGPQGTLEKGEGILEVAG